MGNTRLMALAKMYKTPPVPQSEAAIVAAPVAGHFVPVEAGMALSDVLVAAPPPLWARHGGRVVAAPVRDGGGERGDEEKSRSGKGIDKRGVGEENPYITLLKRATTNSCNEVLIGCDFLDAFFVVQIFDWIRE
jgi:hypothetical protein